MLLIFLALAKTTLASPVVPAFDWSAETEVQGGTHLLNELNCIACHAAPDAWGESVAALPARNLAGIGSRLGADALKEFIRDPQHRKSGTLMPGLFVGETPALDLIVKYLSSLRAEIPTMPAGDAENGRQLYHRVGCVACHEPEAAVRPQGLPENQQIPRPRNPSVPISLAKDYTPQALAHFLLDPLGYRPPGRMPSLHLGPQEAADIAQYLQGAATPATPQKASAEEIVQGREQFAQQRCNACHTTGEEMAKRTSQALAQLAPGQGCLAPARTSGIPHYDLSDPQRRAIQAALRAIRSGPPEPETAARKIDATLARLNCRACHTRGDLGGPEPARAPYFTVNDGGAESLGELAHFPPNLDRVGRKLTRGWFEKILWGEGGSVRPYMDTRMPDFGKAQTEPLIAWLEEADQLAHPFTIDTSGLLGHQRSEAGRKLLGATGLACVSCHGFRDRKSLGPPVIRLTKTVARLRPEYFKELLLNPLVTQPGTVMPPLFTGRKSAEKEIETIWTYLKEADTQPLPEGLFSDADFELKPATAGRPVILRSFIEGIGTHAIGVGFPQALNAGFDAKSCRWAIVWKGRFLDALSNWQDRAMKPIKPLGTDVKELPAPPPGREFRGYRLEKNGVPVMLYTEGGVEVEDKLEPDANGQTLVHTIKRSGNETREVLSW